jgi:hypothetical protein
MPLKLRHASQSTQGRRWPRPLRDRLSVLDNRSAINNGATGSGLRLDDDLLCLLAVPLGVLTAVLSLLDAFVQHVAPSFLRQWTSIPLGTGRVSPFACD